MSDRQEGPAFEKSRGLGSARPGALPEAARATRVTQGHEPPVLGERLGGLTGRGGADLKQLS